MPLASRLLTDSQIPFGTSLQYLGDQDNTSAPVLLQTSASLSTRYVSSVGCIRYELLLLLLLVLHSACGDCVPLDSSTCSAHRSWDYNAGFPGPRDGVIVIIDTMMNLELLVKSSKLPGGNQAWYNQAVSHARQTASNHVRADGSTYHLVVYSRQGAVLIQTTWQGYSASSCWTRGQSWALSGFTMMYRWADGFD